MFRDMRHTHRCVVPIQGYYEWLHQDRQARRAKHEAGGEAADAERDVASDTDNSGDADNSAASPGHSAARGLAEHAGGVSMSARPQPYAIRPTDGSALLFVAGLWRPFKRSPEEGEEGGDGVQDGEFVIVTCPAGKRLSWLHDRMPALLTTEEARSKWLDPAARWSDALAALLVPDDSQLEWFPVTTKMNKLSFDGPECIRRRTLSKPLDSYWPARSRTPSAAASSLAAAMSTGETKPAASPAKISPAKSSASPAQPSASPAKISPAKSSASPAQPSASPAKKHAREDGGKEHKSRAGKRRITDFFRTAQDQ
nr:hypothetical protein HK105_007492 [Polyrhizophydium stewartii]